MSYLISVDFQGNGLKKQSNWMRKLHLILCAHSTIIYAWTFGRSCHSTQPDLGKISLFPWVQDYCYILACHVHANNTYSLRCHLLCYWLQVAFIKREIYLVPQKTLAGVIHCGNIENPQLDSLGKAPRQVHSFDIATLCYLSQLQAMQLSYKTKSQI